MLGKILFDYLSSRTLAFLPLLWPLLHAHAFLLFHVPYAHAQSSPSSHLPCDGSQDTQSQLLRTCLFLCWAWEVNKLLIDAFVYHPNSPFLPHLPSSIYTCTIFPFAVQKYWPWSQPIIMKSCHTPYKCFQNKSTSQHVCHCHLGLGRDAGGGDTLLYVKSWADVKGN